MQLLKVPHDFLARKSGIDGAMLKSPKEKVKGRNYFSKLGGFKSSTAERDCIFCTDLSCR